VRSDITDNFYDDVELCFAWLQQQGVQIGILTNGSADLKHCPLVQKYASLVLSAGDVGAAKPAPLPFVACIQRSNVVPSRVLYVGDSFECDVEGPKLCGLKAAHLIRNAANKTGILKNADVSTLSNSSLVSAAVIEPDIVLNSLHPDELVSKFEDYKARTSSKR
jgi:FMN phosphatase YigB (HAD superfamily)